MLGGVSRDGGTSVLGDEMRDPRITDITRRQHGLITRAEVLTLVTERQLERLVQSGSLEWIRPAVLRVPGSADTWEQALLAVCLSAGVDAVASFRSAAALWSLRGFELEDQLEITTPTRQRVRLDGVRIHDTTVTGPDHIATRRRIPVTSVARTLCDLTACAWPGQVERALDDALRRRLTSLRRVRSVFEDLACRGRRRSTMMRGLLAARAAGFHPGESDPELRVARMLVNAGLPLPVQQHRVRVGRRNFRLDLAYPELKLGIEYDGFDYHLPRSVFDSDRDRGNELEIAGWLVLHFTSGSTNERIVATVRAARQTQAAFLAATVAPISPSM